MPGPKTHDIFYKRQKDLLDSTTLDNMPNYDKYNIFAQGHDFLIYYDFYKIRSQKKLNENIENSVLLQEDSFQEFVYQYLKSAKENDSLEDEATRVFLGPGYIMHHLLDAYTHPQIIYYSGDHTRDSNKKTWMHGIAENLIDIYMMEKYENKDPRTYKVYRDFQIDKKMISSKFIENIDTSLDKVYQIKNGGNTFKIAFGQLELFMKILKYDSTGMKQKIFDMLDPKLKGTSSFSYNRNVEDASKFLNLEHNEWLNPVDEKIKSSTSFEDLFESALTDGTKIVNKLELLCQSGIINRDEVYDLIPNISSTHGLECGKKLILKNTIYTK